MKYLDTSAFVKYYRKQEKGSDKVIELIDNSNENNEQLMSSFIFVGETVSVFDKWSRCKYLSNTEYIDLIKIFLKDIKHLMDNEILVLEPISTSTVALSIELIIKHHLSINDAIHLYTVLSNKTLINQFICSDDVLLKAAKSEGLKIFNPEKTFVS